MTATWNYDPSTISSSTMTADGMVVRRLIGDVLAGDQQLADAEIMLALSQYPNRYLAGAECCRWISAQYSRKVDLVQGELKTNYSQQAKSYADRARELQDMGMSRGAGAMPYTGGISVSDKDTNEADTDRVAPQFNIGMDDNLLLGTVGNQTPNFPSGGGTGES